MFRGLRHTTVALNVRVNFIAPYFINTPLAQASLPVLKAAGFESGRGFTWTDVELVVDAIVRSATDESVVGKAWGVWPDGYHDIGDDEEGSWGAKHMREQFEKARARGDNL
jgi:NAD(P)-dependent dehydrogenase (short-subunit alcohol dehydrogenase family)